jgi:hypothetical protein
MSDDRSFFARWSDVIKNDPVHILGTPDPCIAGAFDATRQLFLSAFRRFLESHPDLAREEAMATYRAMVGIIDLADVASGERSAVEAAGMTRAETHQTGVPALRPRDRFVLTLLTAAIDHTGTCSPTIAMLAARTGFSERTVQMAIRSLEASGLVVATGNGGRGLARSYVMIKGAEIVVLSHARGGTLTQGSSFPKQESKKERSPPISPPKKQNENPLLLGLSAPKASHPVLVNGAAAAFVEFWAAFPYRMSGGKLVKPDKLKAERQFAIALRRAPAERIIAAVRAFPFPTDPQYIQGPAVWLHGGNYLADVEALPTQASQIRQKNTYDPRYFEPNIPEKIAKLPRPADERSQEFLAWGRAQDGMWHPIPDGWVPAP